MCTGYLLQLQTQNPQKNAKITQFRRWDSIGNLAPKRGTDIPPKYIGTVGKYGEYTEQLGKLYHLM